MYITRGLLILLLGCLSACGYHLRGLQGALTEQEFYLRDTPQFAVLQHKLKHNMRTNKLKINPQARVKITILSEQFGQQNVAVSSNTQIRTYLLNYRAQFEIENKQKRIIKLKSMRNFTANSNQLLAAQHEVKRLHDELRQDVIGQLFSILAL